MGCYVGVADNEFCARSRCGSNPLASPRQVFLVVLEKTKDKKRILDETPIYMQGKMILAFPWDPTFDVKTTRMTVALVWVDLLTLNPVFMVLRLGFWGRWRWWYTRHLRIPIASTQT